MSGNDLYRETYDNKGQRRSFVKDPRTKALERIRTFVMLMEIELMEDSPNNEYLASSADNCVKIFNELFRGLNI